MSGKLTLQKITLDGDRDKYNGRYNGGLVAVNGRGTLTVGDDALLRKSTTKSFGGAIYAASGSNVTISGGTFTGNSAVRGGALYAAAGSTVTISGGTFAGNVGTVSTGEGGAVEIGATQGEPAKLTFSDNVTLYNNYNASGERRNVVLNVDNNQAIMTQGLGEEARIGVYVTDAYNDGHGLALKPFATYTAQEAEEGANLAAQMNLRNFINDRSGLIGAARIKEGDASDKRVVWMRLVPLKVSKRVFDTVGSAQNRQFSFKMSFGTDDSGYSYHYANGDTDDPVNVKLKEGEVKTEEGEDQEEWKDQEDWAFNLKDSETQDISAVPVGAALSLIESKVSDGSSGTEHSYTVSASDNSTNPVGQVVIDQVDDTKEGDRLAEVTFRLSDAATAPGVKVVNSSIVCKATDIANGSLLYHKDTEGNLVPAVYSKLNSDVLNARALNAGNPLFKADGTPHNGDYCIKMVVPSYTLTVPLEYTDATRTVILTTETRRVALSTDPYPYTGGENTYAMIARGFEDNTAPMITGNGKSLTLQNITLDGNKSSYTGVTASGGIVKLTAGKLTIADGATLQNSATTGNGGAVYVADGATVEMTGGTITGCSATNGGAICDASAGLAKTDTTPAVSGFTMTGGSITANKATTNGGAVYVAASATMGLKDGSKTEGETTISTSATINGNGATGPVTANHGAGIYLAEEAKLKLEGSPTFGDNNIVDADNYPGDPAKTNGGGDTDTAYSYSDGKVRQDIYVAGYLGAQADGTTPIPATSIEVTGAIASGDGTIWVWAEAAEHYKMLKQFAVCASGITPDETTMAAFHNAQDDDATGCGAKYLTGQKGDDIKVGDTTWKCIYWTGGFDFSFKKTDGFGAELAGATFTLYREYDFATGTQTLTEPRKKGSDVIIGTSSDGTLKNTKQDTIPLGVVLFEKVSPGIHFMLESVVPDGYVKTAAGTSKVYTRATATDTAQEAVGANPTVYVVLLGDSVLKVPVDANKKDYWLTVLTDITQSDIDARTGTGADKKNYAIFRIDPDTGKATAESDIATAGVLNISSDSRKVILKKVDSTYTPLSGAQFRLFRVDMSEMTEGQPTDEHGVSKGYYESGAGGAFFIGKLPYGTYYMEETAPNKPGRYFAFKVDENGVSNYASTTWTLTNELSADGPEIPSSGNTLPADDDPPSGGGAGENP